MQNIELNRPYSTMELALALGLKKDSLYNGNSRQRWLEHLKKYYNYEIIPAPRPGAKACYIFTEALRPLEPLDAVAARVDNYRNIQALIVREIQKHPAVLGTDLLAKVLTSPEFCKSNIKDSTFYTYILKNLKVLFGYHKVVKEHIDEDTTYAKRVDKHKITFKTEKVEGLLGHIECRRWCKPAQDENGDPYWEPLTQEEIDELQSCFKTTRNSSAGAVEDALADYTNGYASKEDVGAVAGDVFVDDFFHGKLLYAEKHGYTPQKVPVYVIDQEQYEKWVDDVTLEHFYPGKRPN